MYNRYMDYRLGREPLTSMANFCLNMLESSIKTNSKTKRRNVAAEMYGIKSEVLYRIGYLCAEKGGQQARKASGKDNDLTIQDRRFLTQAVKTIIRRAAERAYDPEKALPQISLSDLQNHP